jgi:hypothetical protein
MPNILMNDNFYPGVKLTIAKDNNYCPECGSEKVYQIEDKEYYCKKCDCQWSE